MLPELLAFDDEGDDEDDLLAILTGDEDPQPEASPEVGADADFDIALFEKALSEEQEALSSLEKLIPKEKPPADVAFDVALAKHQQKRDEEEIQAAALDAFDAEPPPSDEDIDPVIGEKHSTEGNKAFDEEVEARVLNNTPQVQVREKPVKWRDWQIDFGSAWAPANSIITIENRPQVIFKGLKVMATDSGSPAGTVTRVVSVAIGQKVQKADALGKGTLTTLFSQSALANGISFDVAKEWSTMTVTVSFVQTGTFDMSIFGKAVVD